MIHLLFHAAAILYILDTLKTGGHHNGTSMVSLDQIGCFEINISWNFDQLDILIAYVNYVRKGQTDMLKSEPAIRSIT